MHSSSAPVNGTRRVPPPVNEPIKSYAPGSPEKAELKRRLAAMSSDCPEIPVVVGGREIRTGSVVEVRSPHDHQHVIAKFHKARPEDVSAAIAAATEARREWASWRWEDRAAIMLRAAELLATTWRSTMNAATMLGQSKTIFQSEIDAACEMVDFFRFNAHFAQELYAEQPVSAPGMWNQTDYRGLEGFVYAVSPFNFTAIGGNLTSAPALMGNAVVWKPASTSMLSSWYMFQLMREAGLPAGVINFIPGDASAISSTVLTHPDLAGVHFTGSTEVFNSMWETIGKNMNRYRSYPRIVGETGGKDFLIAHPSAESRALAVAIVRGGFEYQGQKCSALSRAYIPKSLWKETLGYIREMIADIKMGDPADFRNFMGAVIDKKSFDRISDYLADAGKNATVHAGGKAHGEKGWFIEPTIVETRDPSYRLLCEEIFGPVVTVYVYDDAKWLETLQLVDSTSPYALTGAVFARERQAILEAHTYLRNAAGNFYVSGTNDKAGSKMNLMRWVSARTIKETFVPPTDYRYPFMGEE
jgi:1-pyrroline-5-carboxylate dehydrogenase